MQCPFCRAENAAGAKFCRSCGKPLNTAPATPSPDATLLHPPPAAPGREACPSCGTPNSPGIRFCRGCGKSLATPVAAADATQLHIPPAPVPPALAPVDSDATMLHVPPAAQPPLPEKPIAEPDATLLHVPAVPVAQPAEAEATLLAVPAAASPVPPVMAPEVTPEPTAIPCPVCRTGNTPGARFCRSCGGAMKVAEPAAAAVIPEPAPVSRANSAVKPASKIGFGSISDFDDEYSAPMQPSRKGLWVGVIAALISLALAAGGGAAWYFLRAKPAAEVVPSIPQQSTPAPMPVPQPEPVKELPPVTPAPVETPPATLPPPAPAVAPASELSKPQQAPATDSGARPEPPRTVPENKPKPLPPAQNPPAKRDAAPKTPPQAMPAPPPPAPVAPAVPTWLENMRADLDRCARKGGLSGMWCNEKVRHKHCPGHWNTVKECEVKDANPQPNVGMGG